MVYLLMNFLRKTDQIGSIKMLMDWYSYIMIMILCIMIFLVYYYLAYLK